MLAKGPAKKLVIYVNEDTRYHHRPLYEAILEFLLNRGVAGATATRALAGFGAHHTLHTPHIEVLSEHLPIRIEFIESAEKINELLPSLYDMVSDGLIEVQETTVVKAARKEKAQEERHPHSVKRGQARLMRIFLGEADQWHGEPLYDAIVKQLRLMEIGGATVYRGILGYGAKGHTHKQSFWHLSRDLPIVISAVDAPEKIAQAATTIEGMIEDGLIVVSEVEVVRVVHNHQLPEAPDAGHEAR
jgi:PII-like signaling protein